MISKINKKIIVKILTIGLLSTLPILSNITISHADNSMENEFGSVINKYDSEDIVVENGISLKMGESLDLSQHPDWNLSNNITVQIDEGGMVKPISEGTVFLSQKIGDKVHIIEVYVPEENAGLNTKMLRSGIDRNYYKVFVDPGHGGKDPGSSGYGNFEDELNLQIATKVKNKLESKGIEVRMSRTSDVFVELSERARLANEYGADAFISVHQNSASSESASGVETYYQENKLTHKPYSEQIQKNAIKETGAIDRGVKPANFAVLRETSMPSSLFENGFISNAQESAKLADPYYQDKLATAIANGVETYLKNNVQLAGDNSSETVINTGTVINTTTLNVRSGPSTSYSSIGSLSKDSKVEIVESISGWYKIKYGNGYGYVSASYITLDNQQVKFTDINGNWAYNEIQAFVEKGYIGGYSDNTFRPNNSISRAEFVKIANQVFGFTQKGIENFDDVKATDWFYNDVCIAINAGYISGKGDNKFDPNSPITRQEVAGIITSIKNNKDSNLDKLLLFKDSNDVSSWAKSSVEGSIENKYLSGYSDNTIRPTSKITRAESVVTLSRLK